MTVKIITHDRVAHADDTFAAAILRIAFGDVTIQRTRDPEILRTEAGKPETYLLDIGGRYDPTLGLFDHHQPEGAGFRNTVHLEWPYATAGLIWKHFGAQAVRRLHPTLDDAAVQEVVLHIDDTVLKYIDAVDCGVRLKTSGPSLSALIASFNTAWFEPEDDVFPLVLELADVILRNFIKRYAGKVFAREKVRQSERALGGQALILEACFPWVTVVAEEMADVMFVVYPVGDAKMGLMQWQVRAAANADLTQRIRFPQSWGGLERAGLARVSGERDAVFCHRSRHLAGALSLEGALAMAEAALREHSLCAELKAA